MRVYLALLLVALVSLAGAVAEPLPQQQQQPQPQPTSAASASSSAVSIPASYPDGGISMTQPQQTGDQSYYKIASGELVTFGWNFTYVLQKPKAIMVSAVCSDNANTYDLAGPTGIPGDATQFVWDVYAYSTNALKSQLPPLVQASYRLIIRDPEVTQLTPGKMSENSKLTFALYNPQAYTPLAEWTCAECSSAWRTLPSSPLVLGGALSLLAMAFGGYSVLSNLGL